MPLGNDAIVRAAVPDARCVAGDWWDRLPLGGGDRDDADARLPLVGARPERSAHGAVGAVTISTRPPARSSSRATPAMATARSSATIRERLGAPDVALIPIGAYEPRWFMAAQHIDPGGGGADLARPRRASGARHSLGHVPADRRGARAPAEPLADGFGGGWHRAGPLRRGGSRAASTTSPDFTPAIRDSRELISKKRGTGLIASPRRRASASGRHHQGQARTSHHGLMGTCSGSRSCSGWWRLTLAYVRLCDNA